MARGVAVCAKRSRIARDFPEARVVENNNGYRKLVAGNGNNGNGKK